MANKILSGLQAIAQEKDELQRISDEKLARESAAQDLIRSKNLGGEVYVYNVSAVDEDGQVAITIQTGPNDRNFQRTTIPPEDLSYYQNRYNYYETQSRQNRNELAGMRQYYSGVIESSNTKPQQAADIERLWRTGDLSQVKQQQDALYNEWRDYTASIEDPSSRSNLFRSGLISDRAFARSAFDKPHDRFLEQERLDNEAKVNEIVALLDGRDDPSTANERLKGVRISQGTQKQAQERADSLRRQNQERANQFIQNTNESIRNAIAANVGKAASSSVTAAQDDNAFGSSGAARDRSIADSATAALAAGVATRPTDGRVVVNTPLPPANPISRNPLEDSISSTYALTIYVLDKNEVNQLAENAGQFNPKTVIISTAGRNNKQEFTIVNKNFEQFGKIGRASEWLDDFFIDDFKMVQLVAPNSQGRTSNTLDIEFTLIEPYGLSLLDRLISTAKRLREKTYTHLCYLLQIDFYDETGLLAEHSKRIPMQFTNMNIKVGPKGSEYRISALPFSHQAMLESYGSTPANFEVSGATLREFFKDAEPLDNSTASVYAGATKIRNELTSEGQSSAYVGIRKLNAEEFQASLRSSTFKVNSYTAAFNAYQKILHDNNILDKNKKPSRIKVRFHDDIIAKEKITQPVTDTTVGKSPTVNPDTYQPGTNVNPDQEAKNWVMSAGTSVVEVINQAMMNSEYIRSQVLLAKKGEENKTAQREGVVNWWRVLPSVKIIDFDESSQRWSFETTYFVIPYVVYNTRHRHLPLSKVTRAQCVKEYNYLYTGKNTSVIDFQVEFNMLYLTIASGMLENNVDDPLRQPQGSNEVEEGKNQDNRTPTQLFRGSNNNNNIVINPVRTGIVNSNSPEIKNKGLERDPIAAALSAIADSIYTKSTGDMLNATIKIIGDPHLIKQDDIYFNPASFYSESNRDTGKGTDGIQLPKEWSNTADVSRALANNSLIMDAGHVLCYVEIRNPADIDESTGGLRKFKQAGDYSAFTGVFFIYEVTTELKAGAFTQTLELIRYQHQDADIIYTGFNEREGTLAGLDNDERNVSDIATDTSGDFNNSALVTFPIIQDNENLDTA
jgi:hypothetical protein